MNRNELIPLLDEQTSVGFTGKINALDSNSSRLLGDIEIFEGEIFGAQYEDVQGLKAFYNLCVASFDSERHFKYVVEPEIIQSSKTIHFPFSVLKRKVAEIVSLYKENKDLKPPEGLKLLINPKFIEEGDAVTGEEYDLLCAISDYNTVKDIYKNCDLLDYQITNALVSLRKKKAITVVKKAKKAKKDKHEVSKT
ncbi:MAG: hypothetical protein WEB87_05665 [Bacteriovoracaceae bacterium]